MTFGERVFLYCERGTSEALFAEPINAVSNAAFLLAALAGFLLVLRRPPEERNADQFLLPVLVLFIGLGSLAFHLYADRGTALADVVPISLFMLVYFGFALNRFLGVPPAWTTLAVLGFTAIVAITMQVRCGEDFIGFPGSGVEGVKPCLNGSLFYFPALVALMVVGLVLSERGHKAAPWLLWPPPSSPSPSPFAPRSGALRQGRVRRTQSRHAFRMACAERACPVPAAAGEPRRRSGFGHPV